MNKYIIEYRSCGGAAVAPLPPCRNLPSSFAGVPSPLLLPALYLLLSLPFIAFHSRFAGLPFTVHILNFPTRKQLAGQDAKANNLQEVPRMFVPVNYEFTYLFILPMRRRENLYACIHKIYLKITNNRTYSKSTTDIIAFNETEN